MSRSTPPRTRWVGVGQWLFRNRGWLPVPLLALCVYATGGIGWWTGAGLLTVLLGWAIRLWSVAHIGPESRTRGDEVARLTYTGPFELCRNPIYVGNLVMYLGFGLMTQVPAMAAIVTLPMMVHYSLIVRWEEWNLECRLGEAYRSYLNRVPRWFGPYAPVHAAAHEIPVGERWHAAVRSERSTALAILTVMLSELIRGFMSG
jgi:protein-S-isoprenylcysteine O-methyltransferase Ste14